MQICFKYLSVIAEPNPPVFRRNERKSGRLHHWSKILTSQIINVCRHNCWDYLLPTLYMSIQLCKLRFIQYIFDKYEYVICIYVIPLIIYRYIILCISTYGMPTRIIIFIFSLTFIPQRLIIFNG